MKQSCLYISALLLIISIAACTHDYEQTIANLKMAMDKEAAVQLQYAAFAKQAEADSLYPIEALFKAASQAKEVNINNFHRALSDLGINGYDPQIQAFLVQSTIANLQTSIDNEKDKLQNIYPAFLEDSRKEKSRIATTALKQAQECGKNHIGIYTYIIGNIKSPAVLAAVYYVCPECGNIFLGTTTQQCDICGTKAGNFIRSSASATLQDATTGASMRIND